MLQTVLSGISAILGDRFCPGRQKEKLKTKNSKKIEFGGFQSPGVRRTELKIAQWEGGGGGRGAMYRKQTKKKRGRVGTTR